MTPDLPPELSQAVHESATGALEVNDPRTNKRYFICDPELQQKAKAVVDREAIAAGIRDMEAGRTEPLKDAMDSIRKRLSK